MKQFITMLIIVLLVLSTSCASNYSPSNRVIDNAHVEKYENEDIGDYSHDDLMDSYYQGWNDACDEVFWYRSQVHFSV